MKDRIGYNGYRVVLDVVATDADVLFFDFFGYCISFLKTAATSLGPASNLKAPVR